MTEIAFHFGAQDKLAYVCRLLRKAVASGSSVRVLADAPVVQQLDADLWALSPTDFVAHCVDSADSLVQKKSPVILAERVPAEGADCHVLLNLRREAPQGFAAFARVIEVVGFDEADRQDARVRWKFYAGLGYQIVRHDLALKGVHG